MAQDNSIPLQAWQGESPVDNYLQSYRDAKQQKRTEQNDQWLQDDRAAAQKQQQVQAVAKAAFALDTPEKWAAQAPAIMQQLGIQGPVPGFDQRETILANAQTVDGLLKQRLDEKKFSLDSRLTEAQIGAQNASIRHSDAATQALRDKPQGGAGSNAPQGYQWQRGQDGSVSLAPIKGGPADPNRIAPGEGVKVRASNSSLDALEQSLNDYITNLGKTTPGGRLFTRGPEVSKVETGHTDLLLQMKNLYELGVLNGPDYMLMTKIVEDPTGLMQMARGTEGLKAQTDTVKSIIARSRNLNNAKLGLPPAVPGVANAGSLGNELPTAPAAGKPGWVRR